MKISGKFLVKMQPQEASFEGVDGIKLSRVSLLKTYEGELDAQCQGEMFSAVTEVQGSACYVAIEQVSGIFSGKKGSFVLQHYGVMNQGDAHLTLEVVPDSGSGELKGISGSMQIRVEDEQHHYDFEYKLS